MTKGQYKDDITDEIVRTFTLNMATKPGVTPIYIHSDIENRNGKRYFLPDITIRLEWLVLQDIATKTVHGDIVYYTLNLGQKGAAFGSLLDRDVQSYCGIV